MPLGKFIIWDRIRHQIVLRRRPRNDFLLARIARFDCGRRRSVVSSTPNFEDENAAGSFRRPRAAYPIRALL
jgi:hypothetical protein